MSAEMDSERLVELFIVFSLALIKSKPSFEDFSFAPAIIPNWSSAIKAMYFFHFSMIKNFIAKKNTNRSDVKKNYVTFCYTTGIMEVHY